MEASATGLQAKDLTGSRITTLILWRIPWLFVAAGFVWPASRGIVWTIAIAWIGSACLANAVRCGRVHCSIMGPALLILSLVSIAKTIGWLALSWSWIWLAAGAITLAAFLPEFFGKRYFGTDPSC